MLQKRTGQELPWGTLTGVRPTKIPMALIDAGHSKRGDGKDHEGAVSGQQGKNGTGCFNCQQRTSYPGGY